MNTALWRYRVNYGQGQVSERMPDLRSAYAHIELLKQYGSVEGHFVQKEMDSPGEWFAVASIEVRNR